jgi:hypothetical protein
VRDDLAGTRSVAREARHLFETRTTVSVDYYQYYAYGVGGDFNESSVDMVHDGILAPGGTGVRIATGAHMGRAELTVLVGDSPIELPIGDHEVIASACNLDLPRGKIIINSFAGPTVFDHDFGRPLTCGLLVEVRDRDAAYDHRYSPGPAPVEHHIITISPFRLPGGRWRSARIDKIGQSLAHSTEHVESGHPPNS